MCKLSINNIIPSLVTDNQQYEDNALISVVQNKHLPMLESQ